MITEAGEDLDRAIAAQVFGWQWVTNPSGCEGWASNGPNEKIVSFGETWGGRWAYPITPPYSTDIEAAWAVVEAIVDRGGEISVDNRPEGSYAVCSLAAGRPGLATSGEPTTAPHAICLAALAALAALKEAQP